jgi:Fe2+ transport system protein FeoA
MIERTVCSPGRPKFNLSSEQLGNLIEIGFTSVDMAIMIGVSRSTIARRLREFGMSMGTKFCVISDEDLDDIIRSIMQQYPECGQKMMQGHLKERGIVVQQTRVRESMRRTDPSGTRQRLKTAVRRRQYNVGFPMELWHMDGNHKLVR